MRKSGQFGICCLCLLPVAIHAQMVPTNTDSVLLYGRLDVSGSAVRYSNESTTRKSVSSDGSLLGFRGTEQMGGGLAAYFKLESGLNADTGTQTNATKFFNREAFVAAGHRDYGYVELGSHYGPGVWLASRIDPFNRQEMGASESLLQGSALRGYAATFDNSIQYVSPEIGGFKGRAMVQAGEGTIPSGGALAADYTSGNFYAGLAYDNAGIVGTTVGLTKVPFTRVKNLGLASTYRWGPVKFAAYVAQDKVESLPTVYSYLVGATINVGLGEIRTTFIKVNNPGASGTQGAIGYNYFFSKSVQVYTTFARVINGPRGKFSIFPANLDFTGTNALPAGQAENGLEFGLRYLF
jgi:GBP family porin